MLTTSTSKFAVLENPNLLADTITERYRSMVLTMAWTTLRIGEAMGFRRSEFDLSAGTLRVADNVVEVAGKPHEVHRTLPSVERRQACRRRL